MQGFAMGGYHRAGLYTDRKNGKDINKKNILDKYWEGCKKKGYAQDLLFKAMRRCYFVDKEVVSEFKDIINAP